jgi:hypothetical protein
LSKTNMGLVSRRKKILKPKLKYYLFPLSDWIIWPMGR